MAKPDFTGTWTFDPARSVLQIPAPDQSVFVIDHREPTFHVSRTHIVGEARDTLEIGLTTDGTETVVDRDDLRIRGSARWDGPTLVFDSTLSRAGQAAMIVVRYALSADRETIIAHEQLRSASMNYDNVWVFERSHAT